MATKPFTVNYKVTSVANGVLVKWEGLANGDDGAPFLSGQYPDKSIHVRGTFGAGGSLVIEGTNEETPANFVSLNDPQGNILTFTLEKVRTVLEDVLAIRPRVTAGDGTTSLDVLMFFYRR